MTNARIRPIADIRRLGQANETSTCNDAFSHPLAASPSISFGQGLSPTLATGLVLIPSATALHLPRYSLEGSHIYFTV